MSHTKAHRRLNLTRPTLSDTAAPPDEDNVAASTRETSNQEFYKNDQESRDKTPVESSPDNPATADKRVSQRNGTVKPATKISSEKLADDRTADDQAPDVASGSEKTAGAVVRVMAYLSEEEADLLDSLWISLRRHEMRPSKSDILRAALTTAALDTEKLTDAMSQQRSSTLSRQRSSKLK